MFLYLKRFKQNLSFRAKPLHREISVGTIVYYKDPLHLCHKTLQVVRLPDASHEQ